MRIKDVSELTKISVRMLRHYDKIGLLKPSARSNNQYRWYSEQDLALLQQIVALKYLGFSLKNIKTMMQKSHTIVANLLAQQQMLKEQADHLFELNNVLSEILSRLPPSGIPEASDFFTLINRYHMTEKLKQSGAGPNLSQQQFTDYVTIYEQHPSDFAAWDNMIEQINRGELGDPEGPDGERVVRFQIEILRKSKESFNDDRHLGAEVLADIKSGKISQPQFTPDGGVWLFRAGLAYWLREWESVYNDIVANLDADPSGPQAKIIVQRWRDLVGLMLSFSTKELAIGTMFWQILAQQKCEFDQAKISSTPQELVKKVYVKLVFNPAAMQWIEQAFLAHPNTDLPVS